MEKDISIAREILRNRLSQQIINEKYKKGEFKIPIHLAFGHESIAVALDSIMEERDQLVLSHRNIHYNLARIRTLKPQLNEYFLTNEGLAKGQLGSMNLANKEKNVLYTSSILGNNLPVAAGLALGKKLKNEKGIVFVVSGDGAIEEGAFYESLVFLKSNKLPALVIIENNEWSLATKINERRCDIDIKKFVESLDIKYEKLEGNNPFDYAEKLRKMRKEAVDKKEIFCVEVKISTLGDWILKNEEHPNGKFVNYHAGPAPTVNLKDGPLIEKSDKDPVFVLQKYLGEEKIRDISKEVLQFLEDDVK